MSPQRDYFIFVLFFIFFPLPLYNYKLVLRLGFVQFLLDTTSLLITHRNCDLLAQIKITIKTKDFKSCKQRNPIKSNTFTANTRETISSKTGHFIPNVGVIVIKWIIIIRNKFRFIFFFFFFKLNLIFFSFFSNHT